MSDLGSDSGTNGTNGTSGITPAAMRRRCPRRAVSSRAPSCVKGVMLMTKVLARSGSTAPIGRTGKGQTLPMRSNLNNRRELPHRMACFSSAETSVKVALIVFHDRGQSVVMWG